MMVDVFLFGSLATNMGQGRDGECHVDLPLQSSAPISEILRLLGIQNLPQNPFPALCSEIVYTRCLTTRFWQNPILIGSPNSLQFLFEPESEIEAIVQ
jgi:hypothetical protein